VSYRQECDGCRRRIERGQPEEETLKWYDITLPVTAEALEKDARYPTREEVQGCCKECAIKVIQES
jgi:hypothetical protein